MSSGNIKGIVANRNVLVTSLTSALAVFFNQVYNPFWPLYLQDVLGLTVVEIGILAMIQRSENLLFQLPGGILADRIGRKKVTLLGAAARIGAPIILLMSKSVEQIALGTLFSAMASLSNPAFQALIAESLPRDQMGSGYGVYVMVRRAPQLFTALIGGLLMDGLGLGRGTQVALIGSFFCGTLSFLIRYRLLTETLVKKSEKKTSIMEDFREVLPLFKGNLRGMQITSCILQFSAGLTAQLIILYVNEVIGLTNTEWGIITTTMAVIGFLASVPGGYVADRFNRVKLVSFAEAISVLSNIGYVTFRNFYQILATRMVSGIGMGLSGATHLGVMGGPAWYSLMADFVPMHMRGRVNGIMATMSGIVALPAPYIGAYMWEAEEIGPDRTLLSSVFAGLSASVFFLATMKDPKKGPTKETLAS